jgi:hypothetical protein
MYERRWRSLPEISTRTLKGHAGEFPEPVRSLIMQEPDFADPERLVTDLGTFERLLKINKEVMR